MREEVDCAPERERARESFSKLNRETSVVEEGMPVCCSVLQCVAVRCSALHEWIASRIQMQHSLCGVACDVYE